MSDLSRRWPGVLRTASMRPLGLLALVALTSVVASACSNGAAGAAPSSRDGGDETGATRGDGAAPSPEDAGDGGTEPALPSADEAEPNDQAPAPMTLPGAMNGAIDPANDVDVFAVATAPGDFWEWTLAPKTGDFAPHLTVFDTTAGNLNPVVLGRAAAGETLTLQHFVLRTGAFAAVVRDAANVPPSGKGGPTFGYTLTGRKKTPAPIALTLPGTKAGRLASLSSVDLYAFTLTESADVQIVLRAARKTPASTLDTRVSLFDANARQAIGTNDDIGGGVTDSELSGTLPPGRYLVIVENEGTNGTDLSYDIELSTR